MNIYIAERDRAVFEILEKESALFFPTKEGHTLLPFRTHQILTEHELYAMCQQCRPSFLFISDRFPGNPLAIIKTARSIAVPVCVITHDNSEALRRHVLDCGARSVIPFEDPNRKDKIRFFLTGKGKTEIYAFGFGNEK